MVGRLVRRLTLVFVLLNFLLMSFFSLPSYALQENISDESEILSIKQKNPSGYGRDSLSNSSQQLKVRDRLERFREITNSKEFRIMVRNKLSREELKRLWYESEGNVAEFRKKIEERIETVRELEKNKWKKRQPSINISEKYRREIRVYMQHKNDWLRKRNEIKNYLKQHKQEYVQCVKQNFTTDYCKELKLNYTERAKNYLLGAIDRSIKVLEITKLRLESSPYLDEEEVEEYVGEINQTIKDLESFKEEEEKKLDNCTDIACFREVAEEIRNKLKEVKEVFRYYVQKERIERIGVVLIRADVISSRLEVMEEVAEEKGINISAEVNKIESLISEAKELRERALMILEEGKKDEESLQEVGVYISEANKKLNEAIRVLQEVWNKLAKARIKKF